MTKYNPKNHQIEKNNNKNKRNEILKIENQTKTKNICDMKLKFF